MSMDCQFPEISSCFITYFVAIYIVRNCDIYVYVVVRLRRGISIHVHVGLKSASSTCRWLRDDKHIYFGPNFSPSILSDIPL